MDQKEQIKKELQLKANYGVSDPKNIADVVNNKIVDLVASGRLKTPKNYVVGNAMTSAFLTLSEIKDKNGKPVLESCSKESVANALLNMGVLGLTPAKSQCYFIPYGNQLQLSVSYFGKQAILKRLPNIMCGAAGKEYGVIGPSGKFRKCLHTVEETEWRSPR